MECPRILVVDDEMGMRRFIKMHLERENFVVEEAKDERESLNLAFKKDYDAILLDLMWPKKDGIIVAKQIRKDKKTPIIIITAEGDESSRIQGFKAGADDYIVKPFSPRELVLRIKAILRRATSNSYKKIKMQSKDLLILSPLAINRDTYQVTVDEVNVNMTPTEFEMLCILAEEPNKVFSREFLMKKIWGDDSAVDTWVLYTLVNRLRKKLNSVSSSAGNMISTVRGIGYKIKTVDKYTLSK
ncbi:two-component system, OmpR family, response regulator ResD [Lentibacillus persicus]|uniref:Two-component system, OmpR family, response regulator ResD n=1 Tax=Lentibacillus persicus TaxID=640948 RepID=A0A1I1XK50_9BACI|nr:response regulator transcription factor [Lentibacillus persicus]SFE07779.1 two-component system, OmpR family, response regulator ResD [Lentibacillus persicus]